MEQEHHYTLDVRWEYERKGTMCSPELSIAGGDNGCIAVATPPEFPKGMVGIWSPEHLFTASVASCFMTTFLAIADNSRLAFNAFNCHAVGILKQVDKKFQMTEVHLSPVVTITDEKDRERALRVLERTEANCLITASIKAKVTMTPEVKIYSTAQQA